MTAVEASPAGALRERAVPCIVCRAATFNHSRRCDLHRKRCAICGALVGLLENWCSRACFYADEGHDHEDERE